MRARFLLMRFDFAPARHTASQFWRGLALDAASLIIELVLRAWCVTWRKDVRQLERLDVLLAGDKPIIIAFWHGKYFPIFALGEGRAVTVLSAESFRGEMVARIARRFGYRAATISSHDTPSGGRAAHVLLSNSKVSAIAVDGPLGPHHRVRPNLIALASELRLMIVPVSVASQPKVILRKRWDQRELPLPFAKVTLSVGEPLHIPFPLGSREIADWTKAAEKALIAADVAAKTLLDQ